MNWLDRPIRTRHAYATAGFAMAGALLLPVIELARAVLWPADGPLRPAMICLPGGTFTMGSPETEKDRGSDETQHQVTLTHEFALAETEVTEAQYRRVMGEDPSAPWYLDTSQWGSLTTGFVWLWGEDRPVHDVSFGDAARYLNRLSELEGLVAAYRVSSDDVTWDPAATGYRLPTEAEWEYGARAGIQTVYVGTNDPGAVCGTENVAGTEAHERFGDWTTFECRDAAAGTAPVGSFPANGWGLGDMGGNVAEWVWDWYGDYGGDSADPTGRSTGSERVIRGGAWGWRPRNARVANRSRGVPSYRFGSLGFRPARSGPCSLSPSDPLPPAAN